MDREEKMSEIRTTSVTGGRKGTKPERPDLIPVAPLRELARHYSFGAEKYTERDEGGNITHDGANNWQLGYNWSLSYAALLRHLLAFWEGEDIDAETGSKHIIAVAWHAFALAWYMDNRREFDDRPTTPPRPRCTITDEAIQIKKPNFGMTVAKPYTVSINGDLIKSGVEDEPGLGDGIPESEHNHWTQTLVPEWTRKYEWIAQDSKLRYRFVNGWEYDDGIGWRASAGGGNLNCMAGFKRADV